MFLLDQRAGVWKASGFASFTVTMICGIEVRLGSPTEFFSAGVSLSGEPC